MFTLFLNRCSLVDAHMLESASSVIIWTVVNNEHVVMVLQEAQKLALIRFLPNVSCLIDLGIFLWYPVLSYGLAC